SELAPHDLAAHRRHYGRRPQCRDAAGEDLIEAIDEVNLTGRGGAHLPSAIKWRAGRAAAEETRRPVIVAPGAEGEPRSRRAATLLQLRRHPVLDGLACAVEALGADRAVIWLHEGAPPVRSAVAAALAERMAHPNEPLIEIAVGPDAYLSGES